MADALDSPRSPAGTLARLTGSPAGIAAAVAAMLIVVAAAEIWMGLEAMCTCGYISFWHGAVDSQNSQQISDWYSFTHVEHGILFYALLALVAPRLPVGARLLVSVFIEGAWELAENSPFIIDRYRAATLSLNYYGDSVVNSVADVAAMMLGFYLTRRLPVWASVGFIVVVELALAWVIRDNLALNILMLVHPVDAIKAWQLGA